MEHNQIAFACGIQNNIRQLLFALTLFFPAFGHSTPITYASAHGHTYSFDNGQFGGWIDVTNTALPGEGTVSLFVAPTQGTQSYGIASADMIEGKLKVYTQAFGSDPVTSQSLVQVSASLMDSFYFENHDGSSFSFSPTDPVTFHVNISGKSFYTEHDPSHGGLAQLDLIFAYWSHSRGDSLSTIPQENLINNSTGWCDIQGNEHNNSLQTYGRYATCIDTFSILDSVNGTPYEFDDEFNFTFNPNGDFDWAIQLKATSYGTEVYGASYDSFVDVSHTALVSFTGPNGALIRSASGLFPGIGSNASSIPEPTSSLLICIGALGIFTVRSKRSKQA